MSVQGIERLSEESNRTEDASGVARRCRNITCAYRRWDDHSSFEENIRVERNLNRNLTVGHNTTESLGPRMYSSFPQQKAERRVALYLYGEESSWGSKEGKRTESFETGACCVAAGRASAATPLRFSSVPNELRCFVVLCPQGSSTPGWATAEGAGEFPEGKIGQRV